MPPKSSKGLKTLIRLAKFEVDEKQRVLGQLQNREEQILAEIAAGEEAVRREQEVAANDAIGVGFAYANYHRAWMARREQLHRALMEVRALMEMARDELAEAFRILKTYELTQAQREKREAEELARKEQIFLDEVGMTQHRRKEIEDQS